MATKTDGNPEQDRVYDEPGWKNDSLEAQYAAPSATDDDLPEDHSDGSSKPSTPDGLKEAEEKALPGGDFGEIPPNENQGNVSDSSDSSWYKGGKKARSLRSRLLTRRNTTTGIIVGILTVGGFGAFSIVQGPLKILHFAQLISNPFTLGNNIMSDRLTNHYEWARYPANPEQRRLSAKGRFIANRVDARLNRNGMRTVYGTEGRNRGRLTHIEFDANRVSAASLRAAGFDGPIEGNRAIIDPAGTSKSAAKRRYKSFFKASNNLGFEKVGFVGVRTNIRKAGLNMGNILNPIRRLQDRAAKRAHVEGSRQAARPDADRGGTITSGDQDADGNRSNTETNRVNGRRAASRAVATASGIALGCMVIDLADPDGVNRLNNVILPLMRSGGRYLTIAGQVQAAILGVGPPIDFEELGFVAAELDAPDENGNPSSAFSAMPIQGEYGQPLTGRDIPDEAHPTKSIGALERIVNSALNAVGFARGIIDAGCNAVSSTAGQVIGWAMDVGLCIGTGFTSCVAKGALQTAAMGAGLQTIAGVLAGDEVAACISSAVEAAEDDQGNEVRAPVGGGVTGACAMHGTRLLAIESMVSFGGSELTDRQTAQLNQYFNSTTGSNQKSFYARIFDYRDANSLISRTIIQNPSFSTPNTAISSVLGLPRILSAKLGSNFSSIISPKAYAQATEYDYGYNMFGFTVEELESDLYANPYENAELIEEYVRSNRGAERIEQCFGLRAVTSNPTNIYLEPIPNQVRALDTRNRRDGDCDDKSEQFTRLRFFVLDSMLAESSACYEGDIDSCRIIGFAGAAEPQTPAAPTPPSGGQRGIDTSSQQCVIGQDAGIGDTPDPNIKIRLCNVNGITVNVAIEAHVRAITEGAASEGLNIGGGGYRSYETQIRLRREHCGATDYDIYQKPSGQCRPPTARPGSSLHEWGLAVDLTCSGATVRRNDSCFRWLEVNQATHNLINLPSEPWHWSTTGN